jgi:general secretion pathway protein L
MSVLVILLPPRPRGDAEPAAPADYAYVLSNDGITPTRQGRAGAAQLPRADAVAAVMPEIDLSWQRVTVPKAPSARLRDALGGMLEDQLLEDDADVHLALEPGIAAGQAGWVVATHKAWLRTLVTDIERGGTPLDRVLPLSWPGPTAWVHAMPAPTDDDEPLLVWSHQDGVACLRMAGSLARQHISSADRTGLVCSAHPAAALAAERWLEAPVEVLNDAERALQALRSHWNLRQFDLAAHARGLLALRSALRRATGPDWRAVRLGLMVLVGVQLVGLNLWAWQLERTVTERRLAMTRLLQSTHPQVKSVLDAPLQMQRETELLRANAGRAAPTDLEPLMAAADAAWPDGLPPVQALRYTGGKLSLTPNGWTEPEHAAFAQRAREAGYRAENQADNVLLTRGDGR